MLALNAKNQYRSMCLHVCKRNGPQDINVHIVNCHFQPADLDVAASSLVCQAVAYVDTLELVLLIDCEVRCKLFLVTSQRIQKNPIHPATTFKCYRNLWYVEISYNYSYQLAQR